MRRVAIVVGLVALAGCDQQKCYVPPPKPDVQPYLGDADGFRVTVPQDCASDVLTRIERIGAAPDQDDLAAFHAANDRLPGFAVGFGSYCKSRNNDVGITLFDVTTAPEVANAVAQAKAAAATDPIRSLLLTWPMKSCER